jgi:iron complex transport system substrate-binding protein
MRIVSLLPSATEIICALGLEEQLVGVTHECDYPAAVRNKPKVTITHIPANATSGEIDRLVRKQLDEDRALYSLNEEILESLQPDLIVSQTLCDVCAVAKRDVAAAVKRLAGAPRVLNLEPTRLEHVLRDVQAVADAAGASQRGRELCARLRERIERVRGAAASASAGRARVVVLEWLDPLVSCGHWTPELVEIAGGVEPLALPGERSRRLRPDALIAADPDLLLIACCGYSTQRAMQDVPLLLRDERLKLMRCMRAGRVFVTDGSAYFSRPGPRLVDSLEMLAALIRGETNSDVHPAVWPG